MPSRISCATGALLVVAFVAALPTLALAQEGDFTAQGERPLAVQRRQAPPNPVAPTIEVRPPQTAVEPTAEEVLSGKKPKSAASVALREKSDQPLDSPVTDTASRVGDPAVGPLSAKREARKSAMKSRGAVRMAAVDCELLMLVSRLRVARW